MRTSNITYWENPGQPTKTISAGVYRSATRRYIVIVNLAIIVFRRCFPRAKRASFRARRRGWIWRPTNWLFCAKDSMIKVKQQKWIAMSANNGWIKRWRRKMDKNMGKIIKKKRERKNLKGWEEARKWGRRQERSKEKRRISASKRLEINNFAFRANGPAYMCQGFRCHRQSNPNFEIYGCDVRNRVLMDYKIAILLSRSIRYVIRCEKFKVNAP